jgi:predicted lipoprotein
VGAEVMRANCRRVAHVPLGLVLLLLVSATVVGLSACATAPAPSPCAGWAPIRPEMSDFDTMSDALVEQILAHNAFGSKRCGWAP